MDCISHVYNIHNTNGLCVSTRRYYFEKYGITWYYSLQLPKNDGDAYVWIFVIGYKQYLPGYYMVLGCVQSASLKDHTRYLGGRKRLPLRPPTEPTREDTIFSVSAEERMNLGDNVDNRWQESLRALGYSERSGSNPEVGPRHKGAPEDGQGTAGRGGGGGGRGTVGFGPPYSPGGLSPDQGMV